MHVMTNGRIRSIMNLITSSHEYRKFVSPPPLAPPGTSARHVLEKLREQQDSKGWTSPFEMEAVSLERLLLWCQAWLKANGGPAASLLPSDLWCMVDDLVANKVLTPVTHADGSCHFTFATPMHYIQLTGLAPKVFVSHAMADFARVTQLRKSIEEAGAVAVVCEDPLPAAAMTQEDINKWMTRHMTVANLSHARNICIILLTESYIDKCRDDAPANGCKTEAQAACASLRTLVSDAKQSSRLIVARSVPFETIQGAAKTSSILRDLLDSNRLIPDIPDPLGMLAIVTRIMSV